mmetsp:Transcript_24984/g.32619  ORF Transcript_24984/g.32619 Transcript_24984/m.32619 type:complete len:159 (-) Transcript_24984:347-823(-)
MESTEIFLERLQEEAAAIAENIEDVETRYREEQTDPPNLDLKFHYAWVLSKSHDRNRRDFGIQLLKDLTTMGYHPYDCHYALAVAYFLFHKLEASRSHCEMALRISPDNPEATKLHHHLRNSIKADKWRDAGVFAGGAVVAGLLGIAVAAIAKGGGKR